MRRSTFTITAIALMFVILAACGGRSHKPPEAVNLLQASAGLEETAQLPAGIQAQVDALVAPPGCDATLFYRLKKSFVQALAAKLASGGKIASVPPAGEVNIVRGLTMTEDGGVFTLHWPYRNIGDYDQNGTVGITDITPIAMHFGHTAGTDPLDIVIDGDGSGTIGIADVTPLAMYFAVNVTSYRVEEAADETGPYTELGTILLTSGTGADQGWMRLEYALPDDSARWLRVVPLDSEGAEGVPSDAINFGGPGSLPEIVSVSPLNGALGSAVTFQAVVSGIGPFSYNWQFNDAASPDSSTEESPVVTLSIGPSGDYNCRIEVANASGSDTLDFVVSLGNPPVVSGIAPLFGLTGAATQFTVTVTGDAPLSYDWDFGGGATPDTSAEESPTVTLGAPGNYDLASVEVSNPYGSALQPIPLVVYSSADSPVISNAGPKQVPAGYKATFSATVSGGEPLTYSWDFGEAATPSLSSGQRPQVVITDTLTTFPISLTVNNAFGSDTYNFDLKVRDPALYDETEPNDDIATANPLPEFPIAGWHCSVEAAIDEDDCFSFNAVTGDRIRITIRRAGVDPWMGLTLRNSAGTVIAAETGIDSTTSHLDFTCGSPGTYYICCEFWYSTILLKGDYWLDIEGGKRVFDEIEDNDSIFSANPLTFPLSDFHGSVGAGGYDGDSDDFLGFNASSGDILLLKAATNSMADTVYVTLLDWNGIPLAQQFVTSGGAHLSYEFTPADVPPYYLQVTASAGAGIYILSGALEALTLWEHSEVVSSPSNSLGIWSSVTYTGGRPGCFFTDDINKDVYFAYSDTAGGHSTWTTIPVAVGPELFGDWLNGTVVNNKPAVAFMRVGSTEVYFAMATSPDGSGLWNFSMVDTNARYDPCVAQIFGHPSVSYANSTGNLWFAHDADPNGAGTWVTFPVTSTGEGAYYSSLIQLGNNNPGISYWAHNWNEVRFASCDSPDGSGTWTTTTIRASVGGKTCAALFAGKPAVVYHFADDNCLWYSYCSTADGMGTWSHNRISDVPDAQGYYSMLDWEGSPIVMYSSMDGNLYTASNTLADGSGPWTNRLVALNSDIRSNHSMAFAPDYPASVFRAVTPSASSVAFGRYQAD